MEERINDFIEDLCKTLIKLKTVEDCRTLLVDLCTYKEIEQMAQRIKAAQLLLEGKTYSQVIDATDISSATLSRVSKCVHYGSGGYKKFVDYNTEDTTSKK